MHECAPVEEIVDSHADDVAAIVDRMGEQLEARWTQCFGGTLVVQTDVRALIARARSLRTQMLVKRQ